MNDTTHPRLVYVAGALVLVSASVHLVLGLAGLARPHLLGVDTILLPVLFVLAGLAAFALVGAYHTRTITPGTAYATGALLMLLYVVAYVDWHVLHTAETLLPADAIGLEHTHTHTHSHSHDHGANHGHSHTTLLGEVVAHLRDDPVAVVSKTAELLAIGILAPLAISNHAD